MLRPSYLPANAPSQECLRHCAWRRLLVCRAGIRAGVLCLPANVHFAGMPRRISASLPAARTRTRQKSKRIPRSRRRTPSGVASDDTGRLAEQARTQIAARGSVIRMVQDVARINRERQLSRIGALLRFPQRDGLAQPQLRIDQARAVAEIARDDRHPGQGCGDRRRPTAYAPPTAEIGRERRPVRIERVAVPVGSHDYVVRPSRCDGQERAEPDAPTQSKIAVHLQAVTHIETGPATPWRGRIGSKERCRRHRCCCGHSSGRNCR